MKFTSAFLLILILASLAASAASAAMIVNKFTNDFSVNSPYDSQMKACGCENRAEPITITNTGGFYTSYRVDVIADQPWYEAPNQEFTLAPGESRTFTVYAEPPCGTVGIYQYSIRISSSFGRERLLTRTLDIRQCQNVFLTVQGANQSNLCQPVTFHATLKNVAEFADTYHLNLGSFNGYATYEGGSQDTYLIPDQTKEMNITITPPCSLYGNIAIPFTITSEKNKVTEQRLMPLSIENQFDHEILATTQDAACTRIPSTYTFGVHNLINVSNGYDVIVTGPSFMNYDTKRLTLAGNEEKNVTVSLDPKKGDEGTYTLSIKVASDLGGIKKTRNVELDVVDCFAYKIGFVDLSQDNTNAYTDTTCCGEKQYTFNIRNAGQTAETYNIDVDGPAWFAPEEKTINLEPGENRNVKITAQLPCTDQVYEIPITVSLTKYPSISETVTFKVDSQTQRTCHAVETTTTIQLDDETKIVPFIIRNKGIAGGVYAVNLSAELFNGTLEQEITLEPGEEKVLHFPTKANLTDYFDGKYLAGLSVTYEPLNITYTESFWTRLNHGSWLIKAWRSIIRYDYAALPPCLLVALLLLLVALGVAIWLIALLNGRGSRLRTRAFSGTGLIAARSVLVILLILAILLLSLVPLPSRATLYEQPMNDTTGLVFQWFENEQHKVDLSQYFTDPDNDSLQFTATQPAHVAVTIEGTLATLTPEHNWAGKDTIVFTASDQQGGITDSPLLTMNVLRRQHLTFLQWVNRYCFQITLGLTTIILLLLLFIAYLIRPRPEEPMTPPERPGERSKVLYTVMQKDGSLQRLGTTQVAAEEKTKRQPPARAKPGQVFTYKDTSGRTRTLGIAERMAWPEAKQQARALMKPGETITYTDEKGRTRVLGVAERMTWPERRVTSRTIAKPGDAFTYTDEKGRTQTLGVAEKVEWPEHGRGVDKGATVNIAVGTPGAAAVTHEQKEFVLVGAKNGNKVHDPQCIIAQRIPRKNRVMFTNKKDALKAGYGPCKVCQAFDKA